jgi:hypothetical protein
VLMLSPLACPCSSWVSAVGFAGSSCTVFEALWPVQLLCFLDRYQSTLCLLFHRQVEGWLSQAVDIARAPGRSRDPTAVVEVR